MKNTLMFLAFWLPGGILISLAIWCWDRTPENKVSATWLADYHRRG